MSRNPAYLKRLASAIYATIMEQNLEENGEAVLDGAVIFDVLMSLGGTLIAGDPRFATAQGIRLFSESYAKELGQVIREARKDPNIAKALGVEIAGTRH